MNEIATFEDGEVNINDIKELCQIDDEEDDYNNYTFLPGNIPLQSKTLCYNSVHYDGKKHILYHNYYGSQQARITKKYLNQKFSKEFSFILTRSNAPGIGRYSSKWSGDNSGTQVFLDKSISEIFNMGLFGIPHSGADICGFGGDTSDEMCAKWYQVGSLYPFSRSHNQDMYRDKEPFNRYETVLETTKKSLRFRYEILKFYYSEFIRLRGKGMLIRPLFYEFSEDELIPKRIIDQKENLNIDKTHPLFNDKIIDSQFMISSQLMVIPNFITEEDEKNEIEKNLNAKYWEKKELNEETKDQKKQKVKQTKTRILNI